MAVNRELYQKKLAEIRAKQGGGDYWKPKDGENNIRILPYTDTKGEGFFFEETVRHYGLGDQGKTSVICPRYVNEGADCPVCTKVDELAANGSPEAVKMANDLKPTSTFYMLILDKDDVNKSKSPQIWTAPSSVIQALIEYDCDPKWGPDGLSDVATGKIITINREPKSPKNKYPKYTTRPSPQPDPLDEQIIEAFANIDISGLLKVRSSEGITCLLEGGTVEDADAFDAAAQEAAPTETAPAEEVAAPKPVAHRPAPVAAKSVPAAPVKTAVPSPSDASAALREKLKAMTAKKTAGVAAK